MQFWIINHFLHSKYTFSKKTVLFLLLALPLFAQQANHRLNQIWEKSLPFITSYTTSDYKAAVQNWGLIQGNDGIMYAGNNSGIIEYDGTNWKLLKTALGNPVRSLAKDQKGRIYAGGTDEIGYLAPDSRNEMVFHPIQEKLTSADRNFGTAWFTFVIGTTTFFVCDHHILQWASGKFKVLHEQNMIGFSWVIDGILYVDVSGRGLMKMQGDLLVLVGGGEQFKGMGLTGLFPYDSGQLLAVGLKKQVFLYDGKNLTALRSGDQNVILPDVVYHGTRLTNGDYAFGTTGSGLFVMDKSGRFKLQISRREGLNSDAVYAVFEDAEGDIWLATDNGLNRIELNSPVRLLNEKHQLDENPFDLEFFNDKIYTSNSKGLFQLNEISDGFLSRLAFRKINGVDNLTLHCQSVGNELIISNYDGIFSLDKNEKLMQIGKENVVRVEEADPKTAQHHLLFGTDGYGVGELIYSNGAWQMGKKRLNIKTNAETFARTAEGKVFINTRRNGIYEMSWLEKKDVNTLSDQYKVVHHNVSNGLSSNTIRSVQKVGNTIYAATDLGAHRYNSKAGVFEKDSTLTSVTRPYEGSWINEIVEGRGGEFWLAVYHNFNSHVFKCGNHLPKKLAVSGRFGDALITKIWDSQEGIVLFGSNKWIVLYDENRPFNSKNIFKTLIRKVIANKDSVISFSGGTAGAPLSYKNNNLRFQFSLPGYDLSAKNEYQYFLEGFDENWSAWSGESFADFTNLPEGNYVFHVRGRNVYGEISKEDAFGMTINAPWQRTWWAYCLYVLALTGLVRVIVIYRGRKLQSEKMMLENAIRERTETILVQTEELKEMDRMKSRFFANISHEFRTPLTLILGPLEEEIKRKPPAERSQLLIMKRYANRLLELVNQLLNLSKLEAGKMDLRVREGDIRYFLTVLSASFDSLAEHKQIDFIKQIDIPEPLCWYDADKMEKIVINILANAFKFTPAQGTITMAATMDEKEKQKILLIHLSDTGKGIAEEEQAQVFESFYQTRQTVENHEGGTGLGLSLVRELVKLHKGMVHLKSEIGKGSTFSLEIPVSKGAFAAEQLDEEKDEQLDKEKNEWKQTPDIEPEKEIEGAHSNENTVGARGADSTDSILIAEDNPELRSYMQSLLEKEFRILTAPDGLEALELAFRAMPSLVITDLMMPRMDGMELTENLKSDERTSHIPVILLTAKNEQSSRLDGLRLGADDYLTKPFSTEELLVRVRNLIAQRKKLAERFRERILVPLTQSEGISLDDRFLHKVKNAVEIHLEDDSFSVEKMAEEVNLSRTQLLRKLKALTGLSPNDFIRDMRLRKAAEMIRQKADTITQIGYAVGFSDQSYFTKCFKKQFGVTPTEYSLKFAQTDK